MNIKSYIHQYYPILSTKKWRFVMKLRTLVILSILFLPTLLITSKKHSRSLDLIRKNILHEIKTYDKNSSVKIKHLQLVTVVILTHSKPEGLERLMISLSHQELTQARLEVIIVDNGCHTETKRIYDTLSASHENVQYQYLPLCDNPGYAIGNNKVAGFASPDSAYLQFLNDDLVLSNPDFIGNMVLMAKSQANALAVGCKILSADGDKLVEAGAMIFNDGTTAEYGNQSGDIYRSDYSYPKPIDYVAGACLLIDKDTFMGYSHNGTYGFDEQYPAYYEDTDLQMHIQYDLLKEVWFQPKSIAKHEVNGTFGKVPAQVATMSVQSQSIFISRLKNALQHHFPNPLSTYSKAIDVNKGLLLASDVRSRKAGAANILYIEELVPDRNKGVGFGRVLDNLSILAELGHRVTLLTKIQDDNESIIDRVINFGIEYYNGDFNTLVSTRACFYDVVIVRRASPLSSFRDNLRSLYFKCPFTFVYDAEVLAYRRDKLRKKLITVDGIHFPENSPSDCDLHKAKEHEISLLHAADVIISSSDQESRAISDIVTPGTSIHTIGFLLDLNNAARQDFDDREGILFMGDFHNSMYYNGDAIWYFLTEVYPLVLEHASEPIPLKVIGVDIPQLLRDTVERNKNISRFVKFIKSPKSIETYMDGSRIAIAPYLYGAGIDYKARISITITMYILLLAIIQFLHALLCVGRRGFVQGSSCRDVSIHARQFRKDPWMCWIRCSCNDAMHYQCT